MGHLADLEGPGNGSFSHSEGWEQRLGQYGMGRGARMYCSDFI